MNEITTVLLDNEMDLILANKQSMRLAELAGFSLPNQTIFATAVSEVARTALDRRSDSRLVLYTSAHTEREKYITAVITDGSGEITDKQREGYSNARRLVQDLNVTQTSGLTNIELRLRLPSGTRLNDQMVEKWREELNAHPEVSPYEEIKRKNKHLVELSEMLSQSEARYKNLTDSLPLLIFTLDAAGKPNYGNRWMHEYTGRSLQELSDKGWETLVHPLDLDALRRVLNDPDSPGDAAAIQSRLREASTGIYRWHSGIATPVMGADGKPERWHVFMVDIHAQKLVEEALKDNKELQITQRKLEGKILELNRSNHQLEQFAYVASHDLQEPLRKIGVYSDLLRQRFGDQIGGEGHVLFENMMKSTLRMKALIDDVLAYSTISNGKEEFTLVALDSVVEDLLTEFDVQIRDAGAEISAGPLPVVRGNARQFRQLFANLLSNALKFTMTGRSPRIDIFARPGQVSGPEGSVSGREPDVQIVFKDNGIGFEEVYMDKMFGLFQRLHTREQYSGTGIGLAICKMIVQIHGGSIEARGSLGNGAEFIINLPTA